VVACDRLPGFSVAYSWKLAPFTWRAVVRLTSPISCGGGKGVKGILPRLARFLSRLVIPAGPSPAEISLVVLSFNPNSLLIVSRKAKSRDAARLLSICESRVAHSRNCAPLWSIARVSQHAGKVGHEYRYNRASVQPASELIVVVSSSTGIVHARWYLGDFSPSSTKPRHGRFNRTINPDEKTSFLNILRRNSTVKRCTLRHLRNVACPANRSDALLCRFLRRARVQRGTPSPAAFWPH